MFRSNVSKVVLVVCSLCVVVGLFFGVKYIRAEIDTDIRYLVVSGESMSPTYHDGDSIGYIPNSSDSVVETGDVIIFSTEDMPNTLLVKRVLAITGDHVEIKENVIYVNDVEMPNNSTDGKYPYFTYYEETYVGSNELFVVGDNQNNSIDSRRYGCITTNDVIGIVRSD